MRAKRLAAQDEADRLEGKVDQKIGDLRKAAESRQAMVAKSRRLENQERLLETRCNEMLRRGFTNLNELKNDN